MTCRRTFCREAFSPRYFLKRPELLEKVAAGLVGGSAHRQIARTVGCAPSTVTRLANRIGRHCLLLHAAARERLRGRRLEPIVLDHFETFEFSQDLPFGIATAVGQCSWYVYAIDPAPHGRSGKRSAFQQVRLRTRPRRPLRGGYLGSTRRTLEHLFALEPDVLRLISDDHAAYRAAILQDPRRARIEHVVHPNPERGPKGSPRSEAAIARDRAMFAVDLLHGLTRHSMAAHRRETIAHGRRLNALMLRMYGLVVWRNFVKCISERRPDDTTPATLLGLCDRRWTWRRVFSRRRFPARHRLTRVERLLYGQRWITPVLPSNARHAPRWTR